MSKPTERSRRVEIKKWPLNFSNFEIIGNLAWVKCRFSLSVIVFPSLLLSCPSFLCICFPLSFVFFGEV